jgi:hypothetical protein
MKFNINNYVRIRLTAHGRNVLAAQPYAPNFPANADGWSREQLWQVMATFGASMGAGFPIPFETDIDIVAQEDA